MKKVAVFLLLLMAGVIVYSNLSKPSVYKFTFREVLSNLVLSENNRLENIIEGVTKDSGGRYGIFIKNLKTGETYAKKGNETFKPASLYKIWVMGAVLEKIKEGKINEDELLEADVEALNKKYGFGDSADLSEGTVDFSVKSALEQMIAISHNYAAMALLEKAGKSEVENFLKRNGLNESSMGKTDDLVTTPADMGRLFEKIYKGEIIDAQYSGKMIDILIKQKKNDRIPKYLPEGTKIAHKTGELSDVRNDAGIVYSSTGDFVIVILAETKDVIGTSDKIARISEAVYNYFTSH